MASPRDDDLRITITDFTPGIWGDRHGSRTGTDAFPTSSSSNASSALPANGRARIEGTEGCRVSSDGALIPLPRARPTGTRDNITPGLSLAPNRPFRYVLDAQLGGRLVDGSETAGAPWSQRTRQSAQVMWGFIVSTEATP